MKKTLLILSAASLVISSCGKFDKEGDGMIAFAARYGQTVSVPDSDYEVEEVSTLNRANNDMPYTSGEVKFLVDGNEVAKLDYSHGDDYQVLVSKDGSSEVVSLGEDKEDKWDYKKVIVEPLVYSEACGYVVSGIIKFYKDETWVATFDYGDGTCDNLIAKTTEDYENYMFSMDDYPEWNK
jgi:hypothetical protein